MPTVTEQHLRAAKADSVRRDVATLLARQSREVFATAEPDTVFDVLRRRMGWTPEHVEAINDPSYPTLKDLDLLVDELHGVRERGEKIVILPDFDMDGISAGTLGYAGLCELGFDVELYVPDYHRGHDLSPAAFEEIVAQFPTATTVLTCDNGVNSHDGVRRGKDLGLRVLVTDHHVQLDAAHHADVLVDPERLDESYPHPAICGAFVLYQALLAYTAAHAPEKSWAIGMLKLFAGLGTVGDVMPMLYENRAIVRDSLSVARLLMHTRHPADTATPYDIDQSVLMPLLRSGGHHPAFVRAFRGFAHVLRAWREAGKVKTPGDIREDLYGFYFAPTFNAIRRIDGDLSVAFDLFTGDDELQWLCAQTLLAYNELRREQTQVWLDELLERDQPFAPYVWLSSAPAGMLGLIAGRLCEDNGVPTVVASPREDDPDFAIGGSARAPEWFPIISTLVPLGYTALGHEQACGVRAADLVQLAEIAEVFRVRTAEILAEHEALIALGDAPLPYDLLLGTDVPGDGRTPVDGPMDDPEELLDLTERIERMGPFGERFPRPRVRIRVDLSECSFKLIGEEETHLRITTRSGSRLLWWNAAELLPALERVATSSIPGASVVEFDTDLSVNNFLGNLSAQATVSTLVDEKGILDD